MKMTAEEQREVALQLSLTDEQMKFCATQPHVEDGPGAVTTATAGLSSFQAMVASNVEAVMANRITVYVVSLGCGRVMPLSGADAAGYDIPFAFCNLLLLFFSFARGALR